MAKFECKECKKEFFDKRPSRRRKFCSKKCFWKNRKGRPLKSLPCLICGEHTGRSRQKYCSVECMGIAQLGRVSPMKGKKHSKATREKLSKSNRNNKSALGHKKSFKSRKAMSMTKRSISEDEWNGFVTEPDRLERIRFRNTVQKAVFERDNYTCQICGDNGVNLHVDHIQSWKDYLELRFDMNNCRTVCMKCHYEITFGKPMPENTKVWGNNLKEVINK